MVHIIVVVVVVVVVVWIVLIHHTDGDESFADFLLHFHCFEGGEDDNIIGGDDENAGYEETKRDRCEEINLIVHVVADPYP